MIRAGSYYSFTLNRLDAKDFGEETVGLTMAVYVGQGWTRNPQWRIW